MTKVELLTVAGPTRPRATIQRDLELLASFRESIDIDLFLTCLVGDIGNPIPIRGEGAVIFIEGSRNPGFSPTLAIEVQHNKVALASSPAVVEQEEPAIGRY
jgi:hypothetical protein